ncbi:RNA-processing protein [Macleaya cordata]|uniref:RNA-processing protein n=1 Tax=Macleaya cordata TaxID=56857 RepID=A0A200PT75_MACCD|nr:RNA-processing protein [Macleaya cordata]
MIFSGGSGTLPALILVLLWVLKDKGVLNEYAYILTKLNLRKSALTGIYDFEPWLEECASAASLVGSNETILQALILPSPTDFGAWTSLISKIEKTSPLCGRGTATVAPCASLMCQTPCHDKAFSIAMQQGTVTVLACVRAVCLMLCHNNGFLMRRGTATVPLGTLAICQMPCHNSALSAAIWQGYCYSTLFTCHVSDNLTQQHPPSSHVAGALTYFYCSAHLLSVPILFFLLYPPKSLIGCCAMTEQPLTWFWRKSESTSCPKLSMHSTSPVLIHISSPIDYPSTSITIGCCLSCIASILLEEICGGLLWVDIEKICLVYDSFLSLFPLCYGYWKKYANHMANLCTVDKVVEVYERALQLATYSVHLWVDYCTFSTLLFEDPMDVRRLFERGISFVGKDYLCHLLWDKYIEFEYSQKQWSSLAHIYIRSLKFPTKKLNSYHDSFKKLTTIWEEEVEFEGTGVTEVLLEADFDITDVAAYGDEDIPGVIRDLFDPTIGLRRRNALEKYLSVGAQFYQKASQIDAEIHSFESRIKRPYFHIKPLDVSQLENWHYYLDFIEMHGDFDWTVKLYERCLIPCANYPEFWMRYVELMESKGGIEIANFALVRATEIFLKGVPAIHIFSGNFKEKIGDVMGAHASFSKCSSESDSDFVETVKREANMEKRLVCNSTVRCLMFGGEVGLDQMLFHFCQGNSEAAFSIYEKALEMAKENQNLHTLSILYVQFCRFKYMVSGCIDAARDVILQGIQHLPHCRLLLEGLVNFEMMHRGPWKINVVDSIVGHAISPGLNVSQGLSTKDCEDISNLYLEFVDQCGTIDDIRKAWERHRKLFPHQMRHISYNYTTESQDMLITLASHAPEDKISDGSIQCLMLEQKLASPEGPEIRAVTNKSQSEGIDNIKESSPPLASFEVVEQSEQNLIEQNSGANEIEVANHCEDPHSSQQYSEGANEVPKDPDYEPNDDLKPPSLENLSLNPQGDEIQDSTPTVSHDSEAPLATPRSHGSDPQDGGYTSSVYCSSSPICTQSGNSAQVYVQADSGPTHAATDPNFQQTQPHLQPLVPRSTPSDLCTVSGVNWYQMNCTGKTPGDAGSSGFQGYPQTQHPQQWQISPQQQHQSSVMQQEILTHQGYPGQPQFGQITQMQPAENMQQQSFASAPQPPPQAGAQPVSFSKAQVYQNPPQSNEFYGQMQNSQAYISHLWHYYYLQQQQHQQQQQPQPLQEQQQLQQQQQQLLVMQQQQQLQPQLQHQQIIPPQIQTWNSSYYQQHATMQHYGRSQSGQEYSQPAAGSPGQGTTLPNTESSVPAGPAIYQETYEISTYEHASANDEDWFQQEHWQVIRPTKSPSDPSSAGIFSAGLDNLIDINIPQMVVRNGSQRLWRSGPKEQWDVSWHYQRAQFICLLNGFDITRVPDHEDEEDGVYVTFTNEDSYYNSSFVSWSDDRSNVPSMMVGHRWAIEATEAGVIVQEVPILV